MLVIPGEDGVLHSQTEVVAKYDSSNQNFFESLYIKLTVYQEN